MTITRTDTNERFENGVLVSSEQVVVDITAEVVEFDLHDKARTALAGNETALGLVATGRNTVATAITNCNTIIAAPVTTTAQAATQIDNLAAEIKRLANVLDADLIQTGRALRQTSAVIRLLIGADLLVENADT